ncbi:MAG: glycosyltransferase family 4 protein [Cytophagaceae bacterium]|jgi:glycosyltransferase involved in cell wall biosynthesis|nr:glycosyltransferase family 4 protein [Cytophagaceae bacterium]
MKHIAVTAYAISPFKGSEDGTAWNLTMQLANYYSITLYTRKNNREDLERYFSMHPSSNPIQVYYVDLPFWMRWWKRKSRGALLYFYLWQMATALHIRKNRNDYTLLFNLNFHSDWTASFLWLVGKPWVWGPVGHHPKMKSSLHPEMNWKSFILNELTWFTKKLFWNLDPFHRIARNSASLILAVNSSVARHAHFQQQKTVLFPAVGCHLPNKEKIPIHHTAPLEILSVGRLVPLKGFMLTVEAFSLFINKNPNLEAHLTLVGKGPLENALRNFIRERKLENKITITSDIPFSEMDTIYSKADVFLFPSQEGAGMVIPEALAHGLPIICLNNEGPGELTSEHTAIRVPMSDFNTCTQALAKALEDLASNPDKRKKMAEQASLQAQQQHEWNQKGRYLHQLIESYA